MKDFDMLSVSFGKSSEVFVGHFYSFNSSGTALHLGFTNKTKYITYMCAVRDITSFAHRSIEFYIFCCGCVRVQFSNSRIEIIHRTLYLGISMTLDSFNICVV